YAWDFGDGSAGQGATATHTYTAAGTYTVKLTVTDNQGATGETTGQVTVTAPAPVDVVAVPAKSDWSWRYEATAPPAGWKEQGFDASSWKTGKGVLGFGSTGLGTNIDVSTGTSTRPLAAYFIKTFTVDSAASVSKLALKTVADDGVVVYVNGTEVGRSNMPAGTVTFNTYASTATRTSVASASPVTVDVPVYLLRNGTNTIAVETHLNYRATADISFDLSATATVGGTAPNQAPVAKFTSTVSGLAVALDGSTSADADGTIASYAWNYGDNTTGSGATATHTYAAAGTYTVTLTTTDNKGATGVATAPVTVTSVSGPVDVAVVPAKAPWSWRYEGTAPDSAWKNNGFDASAWKIGNAVLGFGTTGLGTNIDVPPPTSSRPLAAYFLNQFNVDDPAKVSKLTLNTVADDGVVVYINGTEVARKNMPAGAVTFSTYASVATSTAKANAAPLTIDVPTSLLVGGINTIAVETHLNYRATPDISFDLKATLTKQP
ncbi:PKD domain-containing protein, partial [Arthrobacter sp. Soil763]|uniref:PKD domain-containing protein n=1 Tax=Arthrobacter sp. Soil763 TaxID=1736402 RepID=UPI001F22784B